MMNSQDMDLLLGRLAVHFQVLTKEQVSEAMRWRRESGSPLDLGAFLVAEGFVAPEVFAKLERARQQWLQKQAAETSSMSATQPIPIVAPGTVPLAADAADPAEAEPPPAASASATTAAVRSTTC